MKDLISEILKDFLKYYLDTNNYTSMNASIKKWIEEKYEEYEPRLENNTSENYEKFLLTFNKIQDLVNSNKITKFEIQGFNIQFK